MGRFALWLVGASAVVCLTIASGCGPFDEFPVDGNGDGRVCYSDTDCVPNDCCGEGGGAVHIQDAPDCRGIQCSGVCDPNQVNCGCGYPVCRNSRCVVAVNYGDEACVP